MTGGDRTFGQLVRVIRAGRAIAPLAKRAEISDSRWGQIERGDATNAETVWRMATALEATPDQMRALFEAAGFGTMYTSLTRIGAIHRPDIPNSAEAGVLADPTLTQADRAAALEFLEGRRALADRRRESEGTAERGA
jgi:transcriptional regulator with XRE-family HTH domain